MKAVALSLALALSIGQVAEAGLLGSRGAASARGFGMFGGRGGCPFGPAVNGNGFNPAISSTEFTYTSSNRAANKNAAVTNANAYVSGNVGTGKWYWEIDVTQVSNTAWRFGLGVSGSAVSGFSMGANANTLGYASNGNVSVNGSSIGTAATFVTGNRLSVAWDRTADLFWVKVNAGNWNNSGAANPATGVGGFTTGLTGTQLIALSGFTTSDGGTIALGGLTIVNAVPVGFNVINGGNPGC